MSLTSPVLKRGAEVGDQLRLRPGVDSVEHVYLQAPLHAEQGREQTDWPRAGDQRDRGPPSGASEDPLSLLPGFGQHRRRLQQHPAVTQAGVHTDRIVRFDAPQLGAVSVELFDPALGVLAVAAEVPLTVRARLAGHRIRSAHDSNHQVTDAKPAGHQGHRGRHRAIHGRSPAAPVPGAASHSRSGRCRHRCRRCPSSRPCTNRAPSSGCGSGWSLTAT